MWIVGSTQRIYVVYGFGLHPSINWKRTEEKNMMKIMQKLNLKNDNVESKPPMHMIEEIKPCRLDSTRLNKIEIQCVITRSETWLTYTYTYCTIRHQALEHFSIFTSWLRWISFIHIIKNICKPEIWLRYFQQLISNKIMECIVYKLYNRTTDYRLLYICYTSKICSVLGMRSDKCNAIELTTIEIILS